MRERGMPAMRQVIRRMPRSHQSGTTARHARGVIGVRRVWAHECGAEAVEALALVAALIALLALLSLVVRDRAAAIGAAATATLAGWLAGAPGAAPVGGAPGVTPLTVTAPPHTVVSLPQLLAQTTDAAPWATWGIGIAGGLLSAAAAWQTATSRALPVDAGAWLRPVGAAVDWLIRQGAGLVIGFCEGVVDTIAGLVTLVVDVVKLIAGDEATRRKYGALLEALARDPLGTLAGIFEAIIAPIVTDWQAGRYGEAIGRTVFELLPAILAIVTGGGSAAGYAAKAGSAGKTVDALADAGRIASHVDDVGRIAGRVDDAARGVDALADAGRIAGRVEDAGKAADALADAGRTAGRVSDAGKTADALLKLLKGESVPDFIRRSEASGGHLIARHVGKTLNELRARGKKVASTFTDMDEAVDAVSTALRAKADDIYEWFNNTVDRELIIEAPFSGGLVLKQGASTTVPGTGVRLVLRRDGQGGWYVHTGYPLP